MTDTMTPAAYIHARRKAKGIKLFDLADATDLTMARLKAIEDGARPDAWEAERIGAAIADDFDVLTDLLDGRHIRLCCACGCHEHDACIDGHGAPCGWSSPDLCSACANPVAASITHRPNMPPLAASNAMALAS